MAFPSNNCWDSPQSFAVSQCAVGPHSTPPPLPSALTGLAQGLIILNRHLVHQPDGPVRWLQPYESLTLCNIAMCARSSRDN